MGVHLRQCGRVDTKGPVPARQQNLHNTYSVCHTTIKIIIKAYYHYLIKKKINKKHMRDDKELLKLAVLLFAREQF